jgi:hypothetical protein
VGSPRRGDRFVDCGRLGEPSLPIQLGDEAIATSSVLLILRRQKSFGVNRRRAARARRRNGLPIDMIRTVARHKYAGHTRHRAAFLNDVAVGVHFNLPLENV